MDNELFELCKEVESKTGWQIEHSRFFTNSFGDIELMYGAEVLPPDFIVAPLYTSDYLLEKLPGLVALSNGGEKWGAWRLGDETLLVKSDTPLKALLKLTLALNEAGELK